jgi:hypothetical protein
LAGKISDGSLEPHLKELYLAGKTYILKKIAVFDNGIGRSISSGKIEMETSNHIDILRWDRNYQGKNICQKVRVIPGPFKEFYYSVSGRLRVNLEAACLVSFR